MHNHTADQLILTFQGILGCDLKLNYKEAEERSADEGSFTNNQKFNLRKF
jgi:hypothetical protein